MKKIILLLCAIFTFGLASGQTDTRQKKDKTKVELQKKQQDSLDKVQKDKQRIDGRAKSGTTNTNNSTDSVGTVRPNDVPDHGANSRDNSRQSQYNKKSGSSGTTTTTPTTPSP
ncbi:hypothetical protein FLLO111716_10305 [Flavobacterium longum]|uniref:hypothetical protein n=1 Tax=Flavobacterium longum TaxID=1299340 RepID=UPI0039EBECE5